MGVDELQKRLRTYRAISLDTVVFIYHFEDNVTYAPLTQMIFDNIETGDVQAIASIIAVAEVLTGAKKARDESLVLHYRALFAGYPNLAIVPVDMAVAEKASDLRSRYGLKMPDAITVATAIVQGADALVTNDRDLAQISDVDVILLADYVSP